MLKGPFVDECPSGVVELVVPLMVRGEFAGTLFCGQVRKFPDPKKGFEYIWERVAFRGCDRSRLESAYRSFVHFSDAELLKLGNLFFHALCHVASSLDDVAIERAVKLQRNHLIRRAVELMQDPRNGFPTAAEISRRLGITLQYFSRLFRKVMNQSFIEYLIELRIARAQELLTNTDLPIIDIAGEVGYERQSYFTKKFRVDRDHSASVPGLDLPARKAKTRKAGRSRLKERQESCKIAGSPLRECYYNRAVQQGEQGVRIAMSSPRACHPTDAVSGRLSERGFPGEQERLCGSTPSSTASRLKTPGSRTFTANRRPGRPASELMPFDLPPIGPQAADGMECFSRSDKGE
jgi:AraC-like DNA-binding protein